MNWKTTLVLILLTSTVTLGYIYREDLPSWIQSNKDDSLQTKSESLKILNSLSEKDLSKIIVQRSSDDPLTLSKNEDKQWTLPGNWPMREDKVKKLVETLTNLETRFKPIAIEDNTDLSQYGLASPTLTVLLEGEGKDNKRQLAFGSAKRSADGNDFYRPDYLRVDNNKEIIRLGSGTVATLNQPREHYLQYRLFPEGIESPIKKGSLERQELVEGKQIHVEGPKVGEDAAKYTLMRTQDDWQLSQPLKDNITRQKKRDLLESISKLYVSRFVKKPPTETGLDKPERTVVLEHEQGTTELLIGKVAEVRTRQELRPGPMGRMMPTPVREEFYYAKLNGNDQIFTIASDQFSDIFVTAKSLRDPKLASFESDQVIAFTVQPKDSPSLTFQKENDTWKLTITTPDGKVARTVDPQQSKVSELLNALSNLEVTDAEITYDGNAKEQGLDQPWGTIKVKAIQEKDDEECTEVERNWTIQLGKHDTEAKKLLIGLKDGNRVDKVDDSLVKLVRRPALAYRESLLELEKDKLASIKVNQKEKTLTFIKEGENWKLTTPVKTEINTAKVNLLTTALEDVEPVDFVTEKVTPEDLDKVYGLSKPTWSVTVPGKTLHIGNKKQEKDEYYAKLDGQSDIFTINNLVPEQLAKDSLAYLPDELWSIPREEIASIQGQKGQEKPYQLKSVDDSWQMVAPFKTTDVDVMGINTLLEELKALRVERYVSHTPDNLKEKGLEKPYLRFNIQPSKENEKPIEVLIGNKIKDDTGRYAKMSDRPEVFILNTETLTKIDKAGTDLLDRSFVNLLSGGHLLQVESKQGMESFTLSRKDGVSEWKLPQVPGEVDVQASSSLNSTVFQLEVDRFVEYGEGINWANYGLDKPTRTVTLTVGEPDKKKNVIIQLGKPVPMEPKKVYARRTDKPGVAVLTEKQTEVLTRNKLAYVDHILLDLEPDKITNIERTQGDKKLTLTRKGDDWQITAPSMHQADGQIASEFVNSLAKLRADDIVSISAEDIKKYGLDMPELTVTLQPTKHTIALSRVQPGEKKQRFARIDNSNKIAVLPEHVIRQLLEPPLYFRDRLVASFNQCDTLIMTRDSRQATFTKKDDNWQLTAPIIVEAEDARLVSLMESVSKLRVEELVAEKAENLKQYGLDKPGVRWQFQNDGKTVLDILIGNRNPSTGRAFAKLTGKDLVFLLSEDQTKKLIAEFRERKPWTEPVDAAQVTRVKLTRKGMSVEVMKDNNIWKEKGTGKIVEQKVVNELLGALANLEVVRYVLDKEENLPLYGLMPSQMTIEVESPSGKQILHLGNQFVNTTQRYGRSEDKASPGVFILKKDDTEKLFIELSALNKSQP